MRRPTSPGTTMSVKYQNGLRRAVIRPLEDHGWRVTWGVIGAEMKLSYRDCTTQRAAIRVALDWVEGPRPIPDSIVRTTTTGV